MLISINWLKDFVDLKGIDNKELIKRFTLATAEVEEVVDYGKDLKGVFVGQILEKEAHPNSEKLTVLKVNVGKETLQIACGAKNCKVGMKVAVIVPGGEIEGHKISVANLGGVDSYGMCLSAKELGISEDHDGIIELPENFEVGKDIKELLDIEDTIFEVDNKSLTNRPDLWCHYGIAREVSAIFERELKPLKLNDLKGSSELEELNIKIEDNKKCYRYSGLKLGNVTEKISPLNMQIRLFYAGMRSLNLLADLTNYVMLEVGQPMHAFDSRKATEIIVKTPKEEIEFTTLDGEERKVDKDTILIYEKEKPVAVAGIMGGLDSEVAEDTTSILLESATFDATSIRRGANKLGIRTEASLRYEKSLDPELTITAIKRFVEILKNIDSGIKFASNLTDVYVYKYPTLTINTTAKYIKNYTGINFTQEEIVDILKRLDFKILSIENENILVEVPSHRATKDVSLEADLVEEVARIYGYDNIVPKAVIGKIEPMEQAREHIMEYETKKILAEIFGLTEVHTYIWNDVKANKDLGIDTKGLVKVLNSTVKDNDEIRSELIPSLLKIANENKNTTSEIGIFEIARAVERLQKDGNVEESKKLAVVLASKIKTEEQLYFKLKEIIEFMAKTLNNNIIDLETDKKTIASYLHPINSTSIFGNKNYLGQMGVLYPAISKKIDKKLNVVAMEIDFEAFVNAKGQLPVVNEVSKYQVNSLDFNFLVSKDECYKNIITLLNGFETTLKTKFELKDIFEDEKVLGNKKSYTFGFELWADDHTLTSEEIDKFYNGLIDYAKKGGLELR